MEQTAKIYVAGHRGLVGHAIMRQLESQGFTNLITRTHQELDLLDTHAVAQFFDQERPDYVFLAAAKVGGIGANASHSAEFYYQNSMIQNNVIHQAYLHSVKKLLFLGSSCIYPRLAPQPMREDCLLSGPLESTNEAYALAKIGGLKMCQYYNRQYGTRFISCMPTNLYGPGDNFDLESSHVLPALIRKFYEAKSRGEQQVVIWGTGEPTREFLYIDDMAAACVFLMEQYEGDETVNIGTGEEISIKALAERLKKISDFSGDIVFDTTRPDGTPRKVNDNRKLFAMGWLPQVTLDEGIQKTYNWYKQSIEIPD